MKIPYSLYLLIKKTPYRKVHELVKYTAKKNGYSLRKVYKDMCYNFLVYDCFFMDYFLFDFINKSDTEKREYASMYWMYRFHRKMNNKNFTHFFSDKIEFHKKFNRFISHDHFAVKQATPETLIKWLEKKPKQNIFGKNSQGVGGCDIKKFSVCNEDGKWKINNLSPGDFLKSLKGSKMDLLEEAIEQHPWLNAINDQTVNTMRFTTILGPSGKVGFLPPTIRIGVNNIVDNFSMGGISVKVDLETGMTLSPVLFKNPKDHVAGDLHPVTGVRISGQQLPFWKETLNMIKEAALVVPQVKTVGWDVAITPNGPTLVEGNHNWDRNSMQVTYRMGIKSKILELVNEETPLFSQELSEQPNHKIKVYDT